MSGRADITIVGARILRSAFYLTRLGKVRNYLAFSGAPNVVFIWIPKCAGTSVFAWLSRELHMMKLKDAISVSGGFPQFGPVTFGHMDYKILLEHGLIRTEFDRNAFKFAVCRNPFDRAVSLHSYLQARGRCNSSFSEFLEMLEGGFDPIGSYNSRGLSQANPQVSWVKSDSGGWIVDKVYKVENLDSMSTELSRMLGVRPFSAYVNQTPGRPSIAQAFTDAGDIERVRKLYREDFDAFEYSVWPNM